MSRAGRTIRTGLVDGAGSPDRPGVLDPVLLGEISFDRDRVDAGGPEHDQIVRPRLPHGGGVPVQLDEQQAFRVGADRLRLRVLVDRDLGVVDEPGLNEMADRVAPKIFAARRPVADLVGGKVGDMHRNEPARFHGPEQVPGDPRELLPELGVSSSRCPNPGPTDCRCRWTRTAGRTRRSRSSGAAAAGGPRRCRRCTTPTFGRAPGP